MHRSVAFPSTVVAVTAAAGDARCRACESPLEIRVAVIEHRERVAAHTELVKRGRELAVRDHGRRRCA